MAVGENAIYTGLSYLAVGRETTFKTYNTCTAALPFVSANFKTIKENKMIEQVETSRTLSQRTSMSKRISSESEHYFYGANTACAYMLQNALGGANITSATASGDTTGAASYEHTISLGNFSDTYSSLCINHRKGGSNGKVFEYSGFRVNELMFSCEIDDALMFNVAGVAVDSTSGGTDVSSALGTGSTDKAMSFANGRVSVESSFASLTTGSYWHVQTVEFGISNNLKTDAAAGRIGSDVLDVMPPGLANFTLNMTMRFDTTTAYDAMINESELACQIEFQGPTISGSSLRESLKVNFPRIVITDAGDPEVSGPDGILTSQVVCHVMRDVSSSTGYAIQAVLRNGVSSY